MQLVQLPFTFFLVFGGLNIYSEQLNQNNKI